MEDNFNKHLGSKLKQRRLALGLTQTKVAKAINVTFQQIQKYEKGTNGVSSIRLLQLSNYLKVPINYFFEDYPDYLINVEKSKTPQEIIKFTNWMTKLSPGFKNCGNMAPKNTQAFGLRKATKKPSLNNEKLLFVERFLSKSKDFEDLTKSKAMYNKYKIPAHLK